MRFGQLELDLMVRHFRRSLDISSIKFVVSNPFRCEIIPLANVFRPNDTWSRGFKRSMETKAQLSFKTTHSIPETCTPVPGRLQKRSKIGLQRQLLHVAVQDEQYISCQQWEHQLFLTQSVSFFIFGGTVLFFIEAFGVSPLFKLPSTVQMRLLAGGKWCGSRQASEAPSGSIRMLFSRGDTCFAPKSFQSRLDRSGGTTEHFPDGLQLKWRIYPYLSNLIKRYHSPDHSKRTPRLQIKIDWQQKAPGFIPSTLLSQSGHDWTD